MNKITLTTLTALLCAFLFTGKTSGQTDSLLKISPTLHVITGLGGNVTVKETSGGVILIDAGATYGAGMRIQQIVKGITSKPITHIVLTHYHYDHTGGLAAFPADAMIIAHKNVAMGLKKDEAKNKKNIEESIPQKIKSLKDSVGKLPAEKTTEKVKLDSSIKAEITKLEELKKVKIVYPEKEFDKETTVVSGNDTLYLFYSGNAHTNGDTWIHFRKENVATLGDLLFTNSFPYIDVEIGANTANWAKIVNQLAAMNIKTYISGHGKLATSSDLRRFASYLTDLRQTVSQEIKNGKPLKEILKTTVLHKYNDFGFQFFREQNLDAVYKELTK